MIIKVQTQALFHNRRNVAMPKACDYALTGGKDALRRSLLCRLLVIEYPRLRVLSGLSTLTIPARASTRAAFRFKAPSAATENLFCSSERRSALREH